MRQMFEQQLVKMWDEKEDAALDSGDPDAYFWQPLIVGWRRPSL